MTRTLRSSLLLALMLLGFQAFAQNGGITGIVKDAKLGELINAQVVVTQGGVQKGRALTDYDGRYVVKPLPPGSYDVEVSYQSQKDVTEQVSVAITGLTTVNINFGAAASTGGGGGGTLLPGGQVTARRKFDKPLLDEQGSSGKTTRTAEEIERMAVTGTNAIASLAPQVYQGSNGGGLSIGGARSTGTTYIVDGIVLAPGGASFTNLPPGSVDQITTMTGGISARYGDVSGGIVALTSKGATATHRGGLWMEHSVEGYNHNSASFNLSGPLLKRRVERTDTPGLFRKDPALGYAVNGQVVYNEDFNPTYGGVAVLTDQALAEFRNNPLVATSSQSGTPQLAYASEFVRPDQIKMQKTNPNNDYVTARGNGRLDYSLGNNITLSASGFFGYTKAKGFSRAANLFNPDNRQIQKFITSRGYVRFTQRFGNNKDTGEAAKYGISNAYYTVQVDYNRDYTAAYHEKHKFNTFDYGYVGKFTEKYEPVYAVTTDEVTGRTGLRLLGYRPTGVDFVASDKNPLLARYTSEYLRLTAQQPINLNEIAGSRGLVNGGGPGASGPQNVYGLFANVGGAQTGWSKSRQDQFAATVDASFDYKAKRGGPNHSFEFGLYYQQRTERSYGVNGAALWGTMRQLNNRNLSNVLDYTRPYWLVNGQRFDTADINAGRFIPGPTDSIFYERLFRADTAMGFAYNLRQKLGLGNNTTQLIGVDSLDPSTFSLDMFTADELLNGGQNYVAYQGYDYTGQIQTGQVNFNDFWTKRDAQGRLTRPMAAFRPSYIAGYLSDYIEYKDFRMTLGVRIDRYDANTKVLRDPYSLYSTQKLGDVMGSKNVRNGGAHPGNVSSGAVVYVNDALSPNAEIVGYRDGEVWYDFTGKVIEDPQVLKTFTSGRDPQPYLQAAKNPNTPFARITDVGYKPDEAFVDYKPQVNVSPRINFSFPISYGASGAVASYFYAHYDILVQRPTPVSLAYATPLDYVTLTQTQGQNSAIGNSNLMPEKTVDYEAGFVQQLSSASAITLTAFYKERRNQIAVRPFLYAYPNTYYSYGNRDFSTTKGFAVSYDLRRTGPLMLGINYTLNYVVGTGSDANSSRGLQGEFISAGLPNLRYIVPLNTDSRHNINVNVDYRYIATSNGENRGPELFGKHPFENAGVNVIFRARSGEPYTRLAEARTIQSGTQGGNIIIGGLAGNRLPWHSMVDLRLDKSFSLNVGRGKGQSFATIRRSGGLYLNAFVRVENLLNTRDVLGVYGYTGQASDDGFLSSANGQTAINNQVDAATFVNLYSLAMNNGNRYNLPRRIWLGLQVNF